MARQLGHYLNRPCAFCRPLRKQNRQTVDEPTSGAGSQRQAVLLMA